MKILTKFDSTRFACESQWLWDAGAWAGRCVDSGVIKFPRLFVACARLQCEAGSACARAWSRAQQRFVSTLPVPERRLRQFRPHRPQCEWPPKTGCQFQSHRPQCEMPRWLPISLAQATIWNTENTVSRRAAFTIIRGARKWEDNFL